MELPSFFANNVIRLIMSSPKLIWRAVASLASPPASFTAPLHGHSVSKKPPSEHERTQHLQR
jgi:hypothetical protein